MKFLVCCLLFVGSTAARSMYLYVCLRFSNAYAAQHSSCTNLINWIFKIHLVNLCECICSLGFLQFLINFLFIFSELVGCVLWEYMPLNTQSKAHHHLYFSFVYLFFCPFVNRNFAFNTDKSSHMARKQHPIALVTLFINWLLKHPFRTKWEN